MVTLERLTKTPVYDRAFSVIAAENKNRRKQKLPLFSAEQKLHL